MIDWIPVSQRLPTDTTRSYLVWCELEEKLFGAFFAGPSPAVFLATIGYDLEHPKPHPCGVGSDYDQVWSCHPSGGILKDGVVKYWAECNRPGEKAGAMDG